MLYHCYRNRCTIVTENDVSLLLILMYSILPKMMYFSLPITGNSCGYVQYNTSPYWSGGHCYSLRILHPQETLDLYLYHFLKWQENNIMALRIGSGLPNIQKKDLLRFPVILPTITQQNKIVSILSAIEEKVSCEISITKYFIKQKEYLLRQLFI